ncbi:MAG: Gfo/Idh/MocA family oxidoreductase [bacterium]
MTNAEPPLRWGIAGPGRIAGKVAADFPVADGARLLAVGSRSRKRAQGFADQHGAERAYGSYRELLDDPDVDVVYIATPHPQHRDIAVAALHAGKAVLVEKAFTVSASGTEEVIRAARDTGRFAMEAMWTRFQPVLVRMRTLLDDGVIGEIRAVEVDLGVVRERDPADRLFAPELGGGALLDLGVYVVSFAQWLLGSPERVVTTGRLGPTGVEEDASLLLAYPAGVVALLTTSLNSAMPGSARVLGRRGWIDVLPRFHHPSRIVLHRDGHEPEEITAVATGGGYAHELDEVTRCVRAGLTESPVMPLADTLAVAQVLDEAGRALGVTWNEATGVV